MKHSTIAVCVIGVLLLAGCATAPYYYLRKQKAKKQLAILELQANHGPVSYEYKEIKRMTGSKQDELGQGGFGVVYKGKLPGDGCLVAVKFLKETKRSEMDFINEVACISRTSHNNCIKLLGYCVKNDKRALIFDFMPNGSLEKFIHVQNQSEAHTRFGWEKRFRIAVGIARGLCYLHEDCKPAILHLDIKPHNILLDYDFTPKLSDFGISKLCSGSHASAVTKHTKGTVGYIAPEALHGNVSPKADVYSYGVVLLEMVGGRKNFDTEVADCSKKIYSLWIQNRLDLEEDLELNGVTCHNDKEIARKMALVALNCVRLFPEERPSMREVLEMLNKRSEDFPTPSHPSSSSGVMTTVSSNPATTQYMSFNQPMAEAPSSNECTTQGTSSYVTATDYRSSNPLLGSFA